MAAMLVLEKSFIDNHNIHKNMRYDMNKPRKSATHQQPKQSQPVPYLYKISH